MAMVDIKRNEPELIAHLEAIASEVADHYSLPVVSLCSRRKARPIPAARQEYFRALRTRIEQCDRARRYRGPTGAWVAERCSYYRIRDASGNVLYERMMKPYHYDRRCRVKRKRGWCVVSLTALLAFLAGIGSCVMGGGL